MNRCLQRAHIPNRGPKEKNIDPEEPLEGTVPNNYRSIIRLPMMWKIFIIMSCHRHEYPWPSLATSSNRSSLPAGLQDYIPYPHIAALCVFEVVVRLLPGNMWGYIGVNHLCARPCFSNSVLHVWSVLLG